MQYKNSVAIWDSVEWLFRFFFFTDGPADIRMIRHGCESTRGRRAFGRYGTGVTLGYGK